jgi:hypothetical protein
LDGIRGKLPPPSLLLSMDNGIVHSCVSKRVNLRQVEEVRTEE